MLRSFVLYQWSELKNHARKQVEIPLVSYITPLADARGSSIVVDHVRNHTRKQVEISLVSRITPLADARGS